jgi:hypothetical protein
MGRSISPQKTLGWVRDVAPWAASASPGLVEAIAGSGVVVSEDDAVAHGLPPVTFRFDWTDSGMVAAWHDDRLALWAAAPAGPERVVIEAGDLVDVDGLTEVVQWRLGDAVEASLTQIDVARLGSERLFRWLGLADGQRHAVHVRWQRGLHTTMLCVPCPDGMNALWVSLTAPEADVTRNERLGAFLRSFRFSDDVSRPDEEKIDLLAGLEPPTVKRKSAPRGHPRNAKPFHRANGALEVNAFGRGLEFAIGYVGGERLEADGWLVLRGNEDELRVRGYDSERHDDAQLAALLVEHLDLKPPSWARRLEDRLRRRSPLHAFGDPRLLRLAWRRGTGVRLHDTRCAILVASPYAAGGLLFVFPGADEDGSFVANTAAPRDRVIDRALASFHWTPY